MSTSENWGDWPEKYSSIIPDVLLQYETYDEEDFEDSITASDFEMLKKLYNGINDGMDDDPSDEVN